MRICSDKKENAKFLQVADFTDENIAVLHIADKTTNLCLVFDVFVAQTNRILCLYTRDPSISDTCILLDVGNNELCILIWTQHKRRSPQIQPNPCSKMIFQTAKRCQKVVPSHH